MHQLRDEEVVVCLPRLNNQKRRGGDGGRGRRADGEREREEGERGIEKERGG